MSDEDGVDAGDRARLRLEIVSLDPTKFHFLIARMPEWADPSNVQYVAEFLRDVVEGTDVRVIIVPGEIELVLAEATDASGDNVAMRGSMPRPPTPLGLPDTGGAARPEDEAKDDRA